MDSHSAKKTITEFLEKIDETDIINTNNENNIYVLDDNNKSNTINQNEIAFDKKYIKCNKIILNIHYCYN